MQKPDTRSWVEISRNNLLHNLRATKRLMQKQTKCFIVVKSNAYGHGMILVAHALEHAVDGFCTANTEEALTLRASGIRKRIIVVSYFTTLKRTHLLKLQKAKIEIPLHSLDQIHTLRKSRIQLDGHIKIDTGTTRIGLRPEDIQHAITLIEKSQLHISGIYSHFADVENIKSSFSKVQLILFTSPARILKNTFPHAEQHMACSAAVLRHPNAQFDAVRLGIHIYGLTGLSPTTRIKKSSLRPALSWKTRVLQIKTIPAQTSVGYNRTWLAKKNTRIMTLPVGYWDGYARNLSNGATVAFHRDCKARVRGTVCMNLLMAEPSCMHAINEGDIVELIGKRISADMLARASHTINYEVITRIHPDIPRILT